MKFRKLRVYCLELDLTDFGRDPHRSESGRACGNFVFFSCQVNNARLCRFPVSQISWNLHTRRGSETWWILSEQVCENLPVPRGLFFQKPQKVGDYHQWLPTSGRDFSEMITILESDDRLACLRNVGFPSVPLESTQKSFPWPVQCVQECTFQCAVPSDFTYLRIQQTICIPFQILFCF